MCMISAWSCAAKVEMSWGISSISPGLPLRSDAVEQIGGKRTRITGTIYPVPGPVGEALLFDGYTSALHGESPDVLDHLTNKTIVCWLQLDAYPWNQLPIARPARRPVLWP